MSKDYQLNFKKSDFKDINFTTGSNETNKPKYNLIISSENKEDINQFISYLKIFNLITEVQYQNLINDQIFKNGHFFGNRK